MKVTYDGNDPQGVVLLDLEGVPVMDDQGQQVVAKPGKPIEVDSDLGNRLLEQNTWKRPQAKSGESSHPSKKEKE